MQAQFWYENGVPHFIYLSVNVNKHFIDGAEENDFSCLLKYKTIKIHLTNRSSYSGLLFFVKNGY